MRQKDVLVCGNCYRNGKHTLLLVKTWWRYRAVLSGNDTWVFVVDDVVDIPVDAGTETSDVTVCCARCGNDFLIPRSFIKKVRKMKSVDKLKFKPKCTNCGNEKNFVVYGLVPYSVREIDHLMVVNKIVQDDKVVTDEKAFELIVNLLRDGDIKIPIICRDCDSRNVDLIPVRKDDAISQIDFDKAYIGRM